MCRWPDCSCCHGNRVIPLHYAGDMDEQTSGRDGGVSEREGGERGTVVGTVVGMEGGREGEGGGR